MNLKIGVHALTSCYGCQLKMASIKEIIDVARRFDIRYWNMISSKGEIEDVDIAFVEGSVTTNEDEEELRIVRENADILIAVGSCAIYGGVQGILFGEEYDKVFKEVYGDKKIEYEAGISSPIKNFVEVDYNLPGCPPEEEEIIYYLATFALGSYPEEKDYPVCSECRRNGYPCVLIEKNGCCLGPLTVAGCNARCLKYGVSCIGCRGALKDIAWFDSLAKTFKEKNIDEKYVKSRMEIFGKQYERMEDMLKKVFENED